MTIPIKNKLDICKCLWILTGILITMPVFTLPVGELALYNIPFMLAILLQPLRKHGSLYLYKLPLYLFIIIMMVSSVMSKIIVPDEWYATSLRAAMKLSAVFMLMIVAFSDEELFKSREHFMKGLIWAVPVQFFWVILQSLCWSLLHIKLNNMLFGVSVTNEGMQGITLTGLSWERADTSFLFAVATAYTKNPYIRAMALIGTIMTTSRSGLLLIALVYGYEFLKNIPKLLSQIKLKSELLLQIMLGVGIVGIMIVAMQYVHISAVDELLLKTSQLITRMAGIFTDTSVYGTKQVDPHKLYFLWLPNTLKHSSLQQLLIGSGTRISGWMYTQIYHRFPNYGPWNIECDFVALILGNGILGFLIYYVMLFEIFITTKSEIQKKVIILFIVGSLFYQFFTSTLGFLLIVFAFNRAKEGINWKSTLATKRETTRSLLETLGIGEVDG